MIIEQTPGIWADDPPTIIECALIDGLLRAAYEGRRTEASLLAPAIRRLFAPVQRRREAPCEPA